MSHLEENSSFVVEYWTAEHGAHPRHPLQVFLCEGQIVHQTRISGKPYTQANFLLPWF